MPDEALRFARQVVVGEAEHVIEKVVNGSITAPIVYGSPVENLDSLPYPDFSLIKGYKTGGSPLPISTSRGCPLTALLFGYQGLWPEIPFPQRQKCPGRINHQKSEYDLFLR